MHIPGIRIERDDETESPFGDLSLMLIFGYGIHWVWVYSSMFYPSKLMDVEYGSSDAFVYFIVSLLFFFGTFLVWSLLADKLESGKHRRAILLTAFALELAGTLFLCLTNRVGDMSTYFAIIAGILTGLGSSTLTIHWGEAFSRQSLPSIVLNATLMIVVATCIYVIIFLQVPHIIDCVLTCCCTLVEIFILLTIQRKETEDLPAPEYLNVDKPVFAARLGVSSFFFGIALGSLRETSLFATISSSSDSAIGMLLISLVFGAIVLIVSILLFRKVELGFFLRPMVPVIVTCLFLYSFLGQSQSLTANFMLLMGYVMFEVMMWVTYGDICHHFKVSPYFVFAIGRGFLASGTFFIAFITRSANAAFTTYSAPDANVIIVIMTALVVGFFLMPREGELARMIKGNPLNADKSPELLASIQNGGHIASAERERGRFKRKCDKVCETYLLSKRETEVFQLLAKGYNMSRIKDELVISEGTAKTHIFHIYKKLDVHNQQELIDLIDEQDI